MRLHQWLLLGAIGFLPLVPLHQADAATVAGTALFQDTGPSGNGLMFSGTFNPSNAFNLNLSYGTPVTMVDFLTITANDTNLLGIATDTIKTTFNFTQPSSASGSVFGSGTDASLFFILNGGNIHWNGPATVNFGNGLDLTIALSDASFFSLGNPFNTSVAIDAMFSLTGSNAQVSETPLPAALPLFATGLGALGLLGWLRSKRKPVAVRAAA
jgi:hypothetical protein